jgi:hypothetical protein
VDQWHHRALRVVSTLLTGFERFQPGHSSVV